MVNNMGFERTERKIRELNQHFNLLSSSKTVDEFEGHFAAFIAAGRTITLALQNDLNNVSGFKEWYSIKQEEMKKDELCRFFKDIRDSDLHTGNTIINSSTHIEGPIKLCAPKGGRLKINHRGVYEIYSEGTPFEKRIQKTLQNQKSFIFFLKPPELHKEKKIGDKSPLRVCLIFKEYLESLVLEAKQQFLDKI